MHLVRFIAYAFVLLCAVTTASAHEFWLSPETYQIEPGEPVSVHLRVGENFKGSSYPFSPSNFSRFEVGTPGTLTAAEGRLGDLPALTFQPDQDGLWVIVHETTDSRLTYREWEKFERFVQRHDLGDAVAQHRKRALPDSGFVESYRRFAKSLIAVGNAKGADQEIGLDVEIVAKTNPYDPKANEVTVQLLQDGAPRPGAQLEVFTRVGDTTEVEPIYLRADENGRVQVPTVPGSEVLLSFIVLRDVDGDVAENQPVWHSLWASLTYAVP